MRGGRRLVRAPRVLKFGGTSVASPRELRQVTRIVRRSWSQGPTVVVASAIRGVTDDLHRILDRLGTESENCHEAEAAVSALLEELRLRHLHGLDDWLCEDNLRLLRLRIDQELNRLRRALIAWASVCRGARRLDVCSHDALAAGERLSVARLVACLRQEGLQSCEVDGVEVLRRSGQGAVHHERIEQGLNALHRWAASPGGVPVVSGFVASDREGSTVTLGRGASDLSATALAALMGAEAVEIWTDTAGILSADPHWVPLGRTLRHLHPQEATALARYGARVLHPEALAPLTGEGMRLRVLSTLEPSAGGTEIGIDVQRERVDDGDGEDETESSALAKSIAHLDIEADGERRSVLAVLCDRRHAIAASRALEGLLADLGRLVIESRIESAGPSQLIVAVVAKTHSGTEELLQHLHQGLCRPVLAADSGRWEESRPSRARVAC